MKLNTHIFVRICVKDDQNGTKLMTAHPLLSDVMGDIQKNVWSTRPTCEMLSLVSIFHAETHSEGIAARVSGSVTMKIYINRITVLILYVCSHIWFIGLDINSGQCHRREQFILFFFSWCIVLTNCG